MVGLALQVFLPETLLPETEAVHGSVIVTEWREPKCGILQGHQQTTKFSTSQICVSQNQAILNLQKPLAMSDTVICNDTVYVLCYERCAASSP